MSVRILWMLRIIQQSMFGTNVLIINIKKKGFCIDL